MLGHGPGRNPEPLPHLDPQSQVENVYKIHHSGDSFGEKSWRDALFFAALVIGDGGFPEIPRPQLK